MAVPKQQIFKLQRPLFHSGSREVLAYNKDRSIVGQFEMPDDELQSVFADEPKVYVMGRFRDEDGKIEIDRHVKEQTW